MRLTIFGASGGTGGQAVRQALDAGHEVTAVVRDPRRFAAAHGTADRLRVVGAEVLGDAPLTPALDGADAVVSALGPRKGGPAEVASAGTRNILLAMRAMELRRLVVVSAGPVATDDRGTTLPYRLVLKPVIRAAFGRAYADLAVMEDAVRDSGLDWTILRPPRLTDGPRTGNYRTAVDGNVRRGYAISRADLADLAVRAATDPDLVKTTVAVAY